jgi:acyl-CoA synthetase (AMP-forming)/AMP-acid ligase II
VAGRGSGIRAPVERAASSLRLGAYALGAVSGARLLAPVRPDRLLRMAAAPLRLGLGAAALVAVAAARDPNHPAIVDELGTLTYGELDQRAAAIAASLREDYDLGRDRTLGVMCRNHSGFAEAIAAGSRCGADLLPINTELRGPQLASLLARARPAVVVHDEEFAPALDEARFLDRRVIAWHDGDAEPTLDTLAARPVAGGPPASRRQGKLVLLTSGTTGTPKSAPRSPSGRTVVGPTTTLLARVPFRTREPMLVATPAFHGFGLSFVGLALFLGATVVVRRRFDASETLRAIEQQRVTALVAVPAMLQRILELPGEERRRHDTSSLRIVLSAAAPLSADLSTRFMDAFGDIVYNAYGSTETGFGAIATPSDLRGAPGTVGRATFGTTLSILDEHRAEVPRGETGHVFVGGDLVFEGYADGCSKEVVGGLMNSGDLGHLDGDGRLFIDGREDDMIVSGGENVFPQEVEDVLRAHEAVADVAVIGIEDADFGQRLDAFVVRQSGSDIGEDELKAHVKANLERYKVPRQVVFLDDLPRNPMGKLLRSRLSAAP